MRFCFAHAKKPGLKWILEIRTHWASPIVPFLFHSLSFKAWQWNSNFVWCDTRWCVLDWFRISFLFLIIFFFYFEFSSCVNVCRTCEPIHAAYLNCIVDNYSTEKRENLVVICMLHSCVCLTIRRKKIGVFFFFLSSYSPYWWWFLYLRAGSSLHSSPFFCVWAMSTHTHGVHGECCDITLISASIWFLGLGVASLCLQFACWL